MTGRQKTITSSSYEPACDDVKRTDQHNVVRSKILDLLRDIDSDSPSSERMGVESTVVHLVGTGLNPSLADLPLKTLRLLCEADVVLYDNLGLSADSIMEVVPDHCRTICVGKRGDDGTSWKQADIDALIRETAEASAEAGEDRTIVRLKGGDPFLFGRARTEIETLREGRIPYTYTPAVSSCVAGPHLAGIPLTDPLLGCQSFGVWSGTDALGRVTGGKDWRNVGVDSLVFLMIGRLDKLDSLCESLSAAGTESLNGDTPCAVIQNAGGPRVLQANQQKSNDRLACQRVWRSTLRRITSDIRASDSSIKTVSPAVCVVGQIAQLDLLDCNVVIKDKEK